jgi:hypothetical protein
VKTPGITLDRIRALIAYDSETGAFTWLAQRGKVRAGDAVGTVQHGYAKATIDREQIKLHRLAWYMTYGQWPSGQIDHINGNKLDNRIANLRDVPMSINMQNRYEQRKTSGLPRGVRKSGDKFVASIQVGLFETAEEAGAAYMLAKRLLHVGCSR